MMIWSTYMAGNFWLAGWPYQIVFYMISYCYIFAQSVSLFFEFYGMDGADDEFRTLVVETWEAGPMRRLSASFGIFIIGQLVTMTPGVNFLSMLVGWWAVLDFYDYQVDPMEVGTMQNDGKWAGKSLAMALESN